MTAEPRATEGRLASPAIGVRRHALSLSDDVFDVLRRARGARRLVALVGRWRGGDCVAAWDPLHELEGDPFGAVDLPSSHPDDDRFGGGWIGTWGYRLGGDRSRRASAAVRPVEQPESRLAFYDRVVRKVDGVWWFEQLTGLVLPQAEEARADSFLAVLDAPGRARSFSVGMFAMTPSPVEHRRAVDRVVEQVRAGDIFQANLAARLESEFQGDPLDLFCQGAERLRPAYAAFVSGPDGGAVASFSPELFLRRVGDEVLTSPIKGTAPLDADPAALASSSKDRAENVMIVDLMRNDLNRVAEPGSVRVPALARVEQHAVWHLVSDVTATLPLHTPHSDLLRATFPPGSVTGAPKIRAMEVIDELERTGRETYTGAVGYVSPCAGLELNVAIRTFEIAAGRVWLGVGGGIVADSTGQAELLECLDKARPLVAAIGGEVADAPAPSAEPPAPKRVRPRQRIDTTAGVFDTVLVRDGVPVHLDEHLTRLEASTRTLYARPLPVGLAARACAQARTLSGTHRLRIDARPVGGGLKVEVSAGALTGTPDGLSLSLLDLPGGLGAHKWADRRAVAAVPSHVDGLLVHDDGVVLETDRASVFAVFDDRIRTPPLDGRLLPGTTRARVLACLETAGLPVCESAITLEELREAGEIFVVNALRGATPVTAVDGVARWRAGPIASWIRSQPAHRSASRRTADPDASTRDSRTAAPARRRVLLIDNYDSFAYNIAAYARELGAAVTVCRNDEVTVEKILIARRRGEVTHIIISPGPGVPAEAGVSVDVVRALGPTTPILGVCLGHQAIVEAYGGQVVRGIHAVHGKPCLIHHDGRGVHEGIPSPLVAGRYHSLVLDETVPASGLEITARTPTGVPMGVRHKSHPVEGVQWHPESILTEHGHQVLSTFLHSCRPRVLDAAVLPSRSA